MLLFTRPQLSFRREKYGLIGTGKEKIKKVPIPVEYGKSRNKTIRERKREGWRVSTRLSGQKPKKILPVQAKGLRCFAGMRRNIFSTHLVDKTQHSPVRIVPTSYASPSCIREDSIKTCYALSVQEISTAEQSRIKKTSGGGCVGFLERQTGE